MTVLDLQRYKFRIRIIRDRFNSFVEKHPDVIDEDALYLPIISMMVDFENAIDNAINHAEVDFFNNL